MEIKNIINDLPYNKNQRIRWNRRKLSDIKVVVVHQFLSTGTVEAVNNFHITPSPDNQLDSENGAPHIAYHFCIRSTGEIVQCNELTDITWHCKKYNKSGIGIALQGSFSSKEINFVGKSKNGTPIDVQLESLQQLLNYLVENFKNGIYGHCELQVKPSCPGDVVLEFLKKFREDVNDIREKVDR
jgi:N-acetyl-anhydromuramyl-L-alanine amidase AmpD